MKYFSLVCIVFLFSCVSKKKYAGLEKEKAILAGKVEKLNKQNGEYLADLEKKDKVNKQLKIQNERLEEQLKESKREGLDNFMTNPPVDEEDLTLPAGASKASFVGGNQAMQNFIIQNIRYPQLAKEAGIQGKVFVSFIVEKSGTVSNVEIIKNAHQLLDKEAMRVVRSMPKWKPAQLNGVYMKSKQKLPIVFKLD